MQWHPVHIISIIYRTEWFTNTLCTFSCCSRPSLFSLFLAHSCSISWRTYRGVFIKPFIWFCIVFTVSNRLYCKLKYISDQTGSNIFTVQPSTYCKFKYVVNLQESIYKIIQIGSNICTAQPSLYCKLKYVVNLQEEYLSNHPDSTTVSVL